jgi:hypothetical protein
VRAPHKHNMRTVLQLAQWDSQPGCHPTTSAALLSTPHPWTTPPNSISNRHTRNTTACRAACPSIASATSNRHGLPRKGGASAPPPAALPQAALAAEASFDRPYAATISNRHLVQLEFAASSAKSTTSLFLIVTKQHSFQARRGISRRAGRPLPSPGTHRNSPESLVAQACLPACPDAGMGVRFASQSEHPFAISNRHLVQLEFAASPTESASSLFLIDPKRTHFPTAPEAQ